jgi:hypothetical protein
MMMMIMMMMIIIISNYVTNKTMEQIDLHEKLTLPQIDKNFPALYGTCWFVTTFTKSCHFFLSWERSSPRPLVLSIEHPFLYYSPIHTEVSQEVSFYQVSLPKPWMQLSCLRCVLHSPPIPLILKESNNNIIQLLLRFEKKFWVSTNIRSFGMWSFRPKTFQKKLLFPPSSHQYFFGIKLF